MSNRRTATGHTTDPAATDPPAIRPSRATTAGRLVRRASLVAVAADVALMGIIGEVIPPLAVIAVLTVGAIGLLRRRPAGLIATLAVIALAANVVGSPFWTQDLFHPADTVAFLWAVLSAGGRFAAIAGGVLSRRDAGDRAVGLVRAATVGAVAVAVVATVIASATLTTDVAAAGDVRATVEDVAFPAGLTVDQGQTVFLDNRDPYRHTFTVEGTALDVALPGGVARRATVDLAPGTYTVVCTVPGHESMQTTLEVR